VGEQQMLANIIRLVGLWRIFINGGNALYYLVVRQLTHATAAGPLLAADIQALIFDLVLGIAVIVAAPALAQLIVGARAKKE
jgi:hypothetical protein